MAFAYTVLDIFAGAGGFSLGFTLENYQLLYALEIDEWAASTLQYNNPKSLVLNADIKKYQTEEAIKEIISNHSIDVIIGGPPCQGFSIAGPKKDPKDPRNSLFIDFAKWVNVLKPKVFVMENVKGIISRKNANGEKVIEIITSTFESLGYSVEVWILNAVGFGVPQYRERVFIVGNRFGKRIEPPPYSHYSNGIDLFNNNLHKPVTVGEAILDLPIIEAGGGAEKLKYTTLPFNEYQSWARKDQTDLFNHEAMKHTQRLVERFKQINAGETKAKLPAEYTAKKRNGNGASSTSYYDMNNRRLDSNKPSFTIPASFYSTFIHPIQNRNITAREAARLQSFPDSYRFLGKRTVISSKLLEKQNRHSENHLSQYNQIGNAVPPLLAKAIAKKISTFLLEVDK